MKNERSAHYIGCEYMTSHQESDCHCDERQKEKNPLDKIAGTLDRIAGNAERQTDLLSVIAKILSVAR